MCQKLSEKCYYKTTKLFDYSMQYFQYYNIILIREFELNLKSL